MKITFNGEAYFPLQVKIVAVALIIVGFVAMINSLWIGVVVLVASALALTTHYGIEIDTGKKTYREFVSLFGIPIGNDKSYYAIEYIFVRPNRETRTMHSRITSATITNDVYDAFLRFSEHEKIHLIRTNNRARLLKKVDLFAKTLGVEVVEYEDVSK
jgi:hypothetical protein